MKYNIHYCAQNTPEWHLVRSGVITGTGVSELLTSTLKLSTGKGAADYLRKLRYERKKGVSLDLMFPSVETYSMREGKVNEPNALQEFDFFGEYQLCGFVLHDNGLFGCSPDAVIVQNEVIKSGLEIKTPDSVNTFLLLNECTNGNDLRKNKFEWWLQCQFCMFVTGLSFWNFISYVPENSNVFVVQADHEAFSAFEKLVNILE